MNIGIDYVGVCTPFICHDGNGNFLLQKRSNKTRDEHGAWEGGSGKLELGMTLEQNVLKEVLEEFGCQGEVQEQLPTQTLLREHEGVRTHWVMVPYFVKVDPKEVKNNEPEKIEEIGWFKLDELPMPLHSGLQITLELCRNRFNKYT